MDFLGTVTNGGSSGIWNQEFELRKELDLNNLEVETVIRLPQLGVLV